MTTYIKGKDGKFAGSIGDGKTKIPTAAPATPAATVTPESMRAARQERRTQWEKFMRAKLPAWAQTEPRLNLAHIEDYDDQLIVTCEDLREYGPSAGSPIERGWRTRAVQAMLHAKKIPDCGDETVSYYHVQTTHDERDPEGRRIVIEHRAPRGGQPASSIGYLDRDGRFTPDTGGQGSDFVADQMTEDSELSQMYRLDSMTLSVSHGPEGTPVALFIDGSTGWEPDDVR